MQGTAYTVLLAFIRVLAILERRELFVGYLLKGLRATDIAGIRVDKEKGLDFRHSSDDSAHSDQFSEVYSLNLPNGHGGTLGQGFEIEVARESD